MKGKKCTRQLEVFVRDERYLHVDQSTTILNLLICLVTQIASRLAFHCPKEYEHLRYLMLSSELRHPRIWEATWRNPVAPLRPALRALSSGQI